VIGEGEPATKTEGLRGARPNSNAESWGAETNRNGLGTSSIDSLAILPFINLSPNPEMEYLSDGIAESVINKLSQLSKLRIMAWSTTFRYKGREVDPQEIGRKLNVRVVLLGRVIQVGDCLSIKTELVNTADGTQLWGEQYTRKLSDIFDLEGEISQEISKQLRLKLTGEEQKRLTKHYTENEEAYQLYLKGRYYWNKQIEVGLKKSAECFGQAIKLDPSYALAYAGLADTFAVRGIAEYGLIDPRQAMPKAKAAAIRALQLDETLAEAQTTLAHVKAFYDWDWAGAEREFKRAIELNPTYAFSHHWYALFLAAMGRHAEAIAEERRAQELDPLSLIINKNVGTILYYAGEYDRSIEQYRKGIEWDPDFVRTHLYLGLAYEQKGMYGGAIVEYQKAVTLSNGNTVIKALLGHACAMSGKRAAAIGILNELVQLQMQRYVPAFNLAIIYLGLGNKDQAFEWLERAYKERSSWLVSLKVEPMFDSLRADPRFQDLLRRVGLAPC
jgi:TolB-like protein/Tfp pilus assembly protein PilF